jgi:hypothetical protein
MKMQRRLLNAFGIALILSAAGCIVQQPPQPSAPQGSSQQYVLIEGPLFSIQKSPGIYETVRIKEIFIDLNPTMDANRMVALRANIIQAQVDIKEACRQVVTAVGYQYLFNDEKRAIMEGRLRQEIIRILKGNFTDKDVTGVTFGQYSISS